MYVYEDAVFWSVESLLPKLVRWCIIMSCHAKRQDCYFQGQGHSSEQSLIWSKYDSFYYIFWTADRFATKVCMIVHYYKPECLMEKVDCCVQGQGHSKIFKMSMNVNCPGDHDTFWIAESFTTKLSMVILHLESDCLPKRLVCCLQGQGHSESLYKQNMTF